MTTSPCVVLVSEEKEDVSVPLDRCSYQSLVLRPRSFSLQTAAVLVCLRD